MTFGCIFTGSIQSTECLFLLFSHKCLLIIFLKFDIASLALPVILPVMFVTLGYRFLKIKNVCYYLQESSRFLCLQRKECGNSASCSESSYLCVNSTQIKFDFMYQEGEIPKDLKLKIDDVAISVVSIS